MATQTGSSSTSQPTAEAVEVYRRWLKFLDEEFTRHTSAERRSEIVRDQLYQLYLGRPHGGTKLNLALTSELAANLLQISLDPADITLEAETFPDVDAMRYAQVKPLLWFWQMFDRSPIGINYWLGIRFRAMLGKHIFAQIGKCVILQHGIEFTYGYNLTIGDRAIVRNRVLLDDRGGIRIGARAVLGSYARVYSQQHDAENFDQVRLLPTTIGANARVLPHQTVQAGFHVPEGAVLSERKDDGECCTSD